MSTTPETDDIFRLYVREWVVVHTLWSHADEDGRPVFNAAMEWVAGNLTGRVLDKDVQLQIMTDQAGNFWCNVKVYKDNLKGEYKTAAAATITASINEYEEYTIVPRNSPADHEIRNYGVTKL